MLEITIFSVICGDIYKLGITVRQSTCVAKIMEQKCFHVFPNHLSQQVFCLKANFSRFARHCDSVADHCSFRIHQLWNELRNSLVYCRRSYPCIVCSMFARIK